MVSSDLVPESEIIIDRPYLYLNIEIALSKEQKPIAENINSMLEALNIYRTTIAEKGFSTLAISGSTNDYLQLEPEMDEFRLIYDQMGLFETKIPPTGSVADLKRREAIASIHQTAQARSINKKFKALGLIPLELTIKDPDDLYLAIDKLTNMVHHDLGNPLVGLANIDFMKSDSQNGTTTPETDAENIHLLRESMDSLNIYLNETTPLILREKFFKEEVSTEYLAAAFKANLRRDLEKQGIVLEVEELDDYLNNLDIDYARFILKPLIKNLASNALKAFALKKGYSLQTGESNQVTVRFTKLEDDDQIIPEDQKQVLNPGRKYLLIIVEDNAIGFDDDHLKNGYQRGHSGFKDSSNQIVSGTGRGMSAHQRYIEEGYGGAVFLQNRTDTVGARQIIALPISKS